MPRPEYEPMDYLSKRGRKIFLTIVKHINDHEVIQDIDTLELSMLANAMDAYERSAALCNEKGFTEEVTGKNGTFTQVIPEYGIMKQQYDLILKHSPKYGLTPGDRQKIFGGMKNKKRVDPTDDLD